MAVNEKEIIVKEVTYDGSPVLVEAAKRDADGNLIASAYAKSGYKNLYKKSDYLYNVDYDVLNYDFALSYFQGGKDGIIYGDGASVRKDNLFGHNYTSYYSNAVDFYVSVARSTSRYASIGTSKGLTGLTKSVIEGRQWNEMYLLLPFAVTDGINENGVFCSSSLIYDEDYVPMPTPEGKFSPEWIYTTGTTPTVEVKSRICQAMLVRFVLDNFTSAADAVDYLQKYTSIYVSQQQYLAKQELHYIIGDASHTYTLECKSNVLTVICLDAAGTSTEVSQTFAGQQFITDFRLNGLTVTEDKKVICPGAWSSATGKPTTYGMDKYGRGLERYNYIVSNISSVTSLDTLKTLLKDIRYTRVYSTNTETYTDPWYSDYVDHDELTVDGIKSDFTDTITAQGTAYTARTRVDTQDGTLHTVHTAIYDITTKKLYLASQEDYATYYEFSFISQDMSRAKLVEILGFEPESTLNKKNSIDLTNPSSTSYVTENAVATVANNIKPKAGTGITVDSDGKVNVDTTVIQAKISSTNKLASDLVDDTNQTNKFVTETEKTTWSGKQDAITETNKLAYTLISGAPTDLNQFKNNGNDPDGSPYASQDWVTANAGKIDEIQANGTKIEPVNKVVNITDSALGLTKIKSTTVDTETAIEVDSGVTKLKKTTVNFSNGTETSSSVALPEADSTQNGLMSTEDYNTLTNLVTRVGKLEGKSVRLLYSTKSDPTAAEIQAFVIASGYPTATEWATVSVIVQDTKHIWNYYANKTSWVDDGVDTVSVFTNDAAGIIKGSATDGKVYAETDGTGSVYGWDALKTRVTNVETNKANISDLRTINGNVIYGSGGDITIKTSPTIYDETIDNGTDHETTITTKTTSATLHDGDIFIIREWINSDKQYKECTTYVYDSNVSSAFKWRATDGNYSAEHVYFKEDIQLGGDYTSVGNVKLSERTLRAKNQSLSSLFTKIFTNRIQPTVTQPSASGSITLNNTQYDIEAGTTVNVTGTAKLNFYAGNYSYDTTTGVTATAYSLTYKDSTGTETTAAEATHSINESFTIGDSSVTITVNGTITHTAGNIAKDNLGDNSNPEQSISAGTKTASAGSKTFTSYRAVFNGVSTDLSTLDGAWIRNNITNKGNLNIVAGTEYSVAIPDGSKRVIFAIPASKGHDSLNSVIDVDGMGLDIKERFTHSTININDASGANPVSYDVFYCENTNGLSVTTYKFKFN